MEIDAQTFLIVTLVGLVAGCVATLSDGRSLIRSALAGIVGAFLGDLFFTGSGIRVPIDDPLMAQIAGAAIGASIAVALMGKLLRSSDA